MFLCVGMRKILFVLLAALPLTSFSQNVVTNLVRLPVFCDVAGRYQGTYTEGTWIADIDAYTGIVSVSVQSSKQLTMSQGNIVRDKDNVFLSVVLPDYSAWRGTFTLSETPTVAGKWLSFYKDGTFKAARESYPTATCKRFVEQQSH
ncbi:MAG: hypothetical protein V4525_17085 [Pseudomonadota bacterium]